MISIIVPIYNSDKYLERCIKSLVGQTYKNVEIVLVNDGSTDGSSRICEWFALRYKNIKYVSTENCGCVRARKVGMQAATGSVIAFVDSDDWVEENTIEEMYQKLIENNADMVVAGYYENVFDEEKLILNAIDCGVYREEALEQHIYPRMLCIAPFFGFGIIPFLVNKLFRREIIEKYILEVDDQITIGEDVVRVYPALLASKCVCVLDTAYYHYRIHKNSMMSADSDIMREYKNIQLQDVYLRKIFESHPMKEELLTQLDRYIIHHQLVRCLPLCNQLSEKGTCFPFQEMEKNSKLLIYGAGAFGRASYSFFQASDVYTVVGWCDTDYKKYRNLGYKVEPIELALNEDYDYIVISVMNRKTVEIIKNLLKERGVLEKKLIWISV